MEQTVRVRIIHTAPLYWPAPPPNFSLCRCLHTRPMIEMSAFDYLGLERSISHRHQEDILSHSWLLIVSSVKPVVGGWEG